LTWSVHTSRLTTVDTTRLQTAAIATDDDGRSYRIFVGGMGVLGRITAMVAAMVLSGVFSEMQILAASRVLVAAVIVISFLALGIMTHEIARGLDAQADKG
jgi:hypothetical protein